MRRKIKPSNLSAGLTLSPTMERSIGLTALDRDLSRSTSEPATELSDIASNSSPEPYPDPATQLSTELGTATDALNATLLRAEKYLASLKLGVAADILLSEEDHESATWRQFLSFAKQGNNWKLLVVSFSEDSEPHEQTILPLINASRETRLRAARLIPELEKCLFEAYRQQIEEVTRVTANLDDWLLERTNLKAST